MAELPYNLNWGLDPSPEEAAFLARYPIIVCDVGSRGDAPEELESLFPHMIYYAFEADEAECARLDAQPHPYLERRVVFGYVGAHAGTAAFNLYAERGRSSIYRPSQRYLSAFGDADSFRLDRTVDVEASTLDEILAAEDLEGPDFLKLDTQGSELDILRHATRTLAGAHLIEVEVEFTAIYEGQPLFHEVAQFLAEHDFELLYLNRCFSQRKAVYRGPARGQMTYGDALFGRREDRLQGASPESLAKYALLLINYGHRDLALHVVRTHPVIVEVLPNIGRQFATDNHGTPLRRVLVSQADKLAMLWLHVRRYNHFNNDSDRSWPVR